jgi:hypothetical protein
LPPPEEIAARFEGDIVIDGNVYVGGGLALGSSNVAISAATKLTASEQTVMKADVWKLSNTLSITADSANNIVMTTGFAEGTSSATTTTATSSVNNQLLYNTSYLPIGLQSLLQQDPGSGAQLWDTLRAPMAPLAPGNDVRTAECGMLVMANTPTSIQLTTNPYEMRVIGVYIRSEADAAEAQVGPFELRAPMTPAGAGVVPTQAVVQTRGAGHVMACGENGPIRAGDLLTSSSTHGVAMRQNDDIVRSCTVAKAISDVEFSSPGETSLVWSLVMVA